MSNSFKFLMSAGLYACLITVGVSCTDSKDFVDGNENTPTTPSKTRANSFDFSTTQEVDLIVDYSAFNANVPVFFSVYNVNPFVNENQIGEYIDESIKPIFSGYTNKNGLFDETVTLPKYAKRLHIITGNFLVGLRRTVVEVIDDEARAIVDNPMAKTTRSATNRVVGTGTPTNDLSKLSNLYMGKNVQRYKKWYTPLGQWDSNSGRPLYLLDKASAAPGLVFTDEEFDGLYATACSALNSGTSVKESYRAAADMTLAMDSEVSITMLGSSTCWNSSLGYYYYTGDAPTNKMDLNIIMIFPNTQDGEWPRGNYPNNNYRGNIGALRGDVVQLMYYPNIANNGDTSGATTMFPAGTKIGFILKSNGWACQGTNYAVNSCTNLKNIWAASTDGLSTDLDGGKKPNPNGESRTAKFGFESVNGNKYAIISFEDATDDQDYDDLVFALNPANAFEGMSTVKNREVSTFGVYGFEDKWPLAHDYDMNDGLFEVEHVKEFYAHNGKSETLVKETFNIRSDHNYITQENSFGVRLNTKAPIATIYANKAPTGTAPDPSTASKADSKMYYWHPNFTFVKSSTSSSDGIYYYYFNDIYNNDRGKTTYSIEVTYTSEQTDSKASVQVFLCRKEGSGYREVHVPYEAPGPKVIDKYFGTEDDLSDHAKKKNYYTTTGKYPFGFYLADAKLDDFRTTLLDPAKESIPVDLQFEEFGGWSLSSGKSYKDWYKHPNPNAKKPE